MLIISNGHIWISRMVTSEETHTHTETYSRRPGRCRPPAEQLQALPGRRWALCCSLWVHGAPRRQTLERAAVHQDLSAVTVQHMNLDLKSWVGLPSVFDDSIPGAGKRHKYPLRKMCMHVCLPCCSSCPELDGCSSPLESSWLKSFW